MKKSERRKIKLKAILVEKFHISDAKKYIGGNFHVRNKDYTPTRFILHTKIVDMHESLFKLRAMEKQLPMPVKIVVISTNIYLWPMSNFMLVKYYERKIFVRCQNCDCFLDSGVDYAVLDNQTRANYCPHCGQKLWWPK